MVVPLNLKTTVLQDVMIANHFSKETTYIALVIY